MPIKRIPILDDVTWMRLQRALDSASQQRSGVRHDASPFLGVAVCGECGSAPHAFRFTRRERKYAYQVIRPDYETVMANLQKEHARLKALPVGESTVEIVETGITHGQHWAGLDMVGRGSFPATLGLKVLASRREGEVVILWTTAEGESDNGVYVSVLPA